MVSKEASGGMVDENERDVGGVTRRSERKRAEGYSVVRLHGLFGLGSTSNVQKALLSTPAMGGVKGDIGISKERRSRDGNGGMHRERGVVRNRQRYLCGVWVGCVLCVVCACDV